MSEHQILTVDPWLKKDAATAAIPPESTFLCAYGVHIGIDTVDEAAFLLRTIDTDELWLAIEPDRDLLSHLPDVSALIEIDRSRCMSLGRAVVARKTSDAGSASRALLDVLFRARVGFGWPTYLILGGAIDDVAFQSLVEAIKRELDDNARKASREEAEIVISARELGLNPEPTGTGPHHWRARCPGTNHGLKIQSATNQFGCGYCRRNGGPEELRVFAGERRTTRKGGEGAK